MPREVQGEPRRVGLAELAPTLGRIETTSLRISLRAKDAVWLPSFLGSTLRGALARALRRLSCALRDEECPNCLLRERCSYSYLFETPRPYGSDRLRGQEQIPHPLVLTPPEPRMEPWSPGEELAFSVTLFGRAIEHLPHLVVGLARMAEGGLGRRRARFDLLEVRTSPLAADPMLVYTPGSPLRPVVPERLACFLDHRGLVASDEVTLQLVTPTRLTREGRLTRTPGLDDLARSLLQRALAILHFHGAADVDIDLQWLTAYSSAARVRSSDLRLVRLRRYSTRQRRMVPIDGMLGTICFAGQPVLDLWPLLAAGEVLRVGK